MPVGAFWVSFDMVNSSIKTAQAAAVENIEQKYAVNNVLWGTVSGQEESLFAAGSTKDITITVTTESGTKLEVLYKLGDNSEPILSDMPQRSGSAATPVTIENFKRNTTS